MAGTVKVSKRHQISVPSAVRKRLGIKEGDRLLVEVKGDMMILLREPRDYVDRLSGLHEEIWCDVDVDAYLDGERMGWND
jgi:AbrB family looped-hinge helix DNA binding protein